MKYGTIIAVLVLIFIFVVLIVFSRKFDIPVKRNGVWKYIDSMSYLLILIFRYFFEKKNVFRNERIQNRRNLALLNPGENEDLIEDEYLIKKLSLSLLVIFVGLVFTLLVFISDSFGNTVYTSEGINRNAYGGDAFDVTITTDLLGKEEIDVTVYPRELTEDEVYETYEKFCMELEHVLIGDNPDLNHISEKLNLVSRIYGYPFKVSWVSSDIVLVSPWNGDVQEVYEECQVVLTAKIIYGKYQFEREFLLTVVPKDYSEKEQIRNELINMLVDSENVNRSEDYWNLPNEYNGTTIVWNIKKSGIGMYILPIVLIISVVLYFLSDKDLKKKAEENKREMRGAYPEIVNQMVLYIGAGMTVRATFGKIAEDALNKGKTNPIYKEMMYVCRKMQSGMMETEAYEMLGKRTDVQEYIKMGTLLGQNIKKGNNDLIARLKDEAEKAVNEKYQRCRKECEEATTKLLFPMIMMLLVIMVIIMVPAFSSMKI